MRKLLNTNDFCIRKFRFSINTKVNMKTLNLLFCCIFLVLLSTKLSAKVVLPRLISDGVVLQRNIKIPIWGWADVGEKVTVSFNGKTYVVNTGTDKKWKVMLNPEKEGGPFKMTISGTNKITIQNILVGDVWLCSGQSNMEYELYKSAALYPKEIASSTNDKIRHFLVKRNVDFSDFSKVNSVKGWQAASPSTVPDFTAVGYFFARSLFEKYKIPIGIIDCSYGGTPVEAWLDESALKDYPDYYSKAIAYKDSALVEKITNRDKEIVDNWFKKINNSDVGSKEKWQDTAYSFADWKTMQVPGILEDKNLGEDEGSVVWFKKEIDISPADAGKNAVLKVGNIFIRDITYFNGVKVGETSNKYFGRNYPIDGKILKVGKNVITIRVLNEIDYPEFIKDKPYQFEVGDKIIDLKGDWKYKISCKTEPLKRSEITGFNKQPTAMYHGMIEPLIGYGIKGIAWYQGESNISKYQEYHQLFSRLITQWREKWGQGNFPFLFVQIANHNSPNSEPGESSLASLQEAQQQTLSVPNTGMAVINDIGEWNDVHPKNKLDVGKRLALVAEKVAYGDNSVVFSGPTYQSMKIVGNKIVLNFSNVGSGLMAKNGGELKYFSIAGADKKFVWANAKIVGNTVEVWNDNIKSPIAVRYAWADDPEGANLYNKEGLPASVFRTDKGFEGKK
nr:sialate O-acetylesterase [uncultured Pedobacter sp.]